MQSQVTVKPPYLIEPLTDYLHPKVIMCSRFVKFHESLLNCKKPLLRLLSNLNQNNLRTVYGSNLRKIASLCELKVENLNYGHVKTNMKYFPLPENESWRIPLIHELMALKAQTHILPGFSYDEINDMLIQACIS